MDSHTPAQDSIRHLLRAVSERRAADQLTDLAAKYWGRLGRGYGGDRDDLVQDLWVIALDWHRRARGGPPADCGSAVEDAVREGEVKRAVQVAVREADNAEWCWVQWADHLAEDLAAPDVTPQGRPRWSDDQLQRLNAVWNVVRCHAGGYAAVRMLLLRGEGQSFADIAAELNADPAAGGGEVPLTRDTVREGLKQLRKKLRKKLKRRLRRLGEDGTGRPAVGWPEMVYGDQPEYADPSDSRQRWPGKEAGYEGRVKTPGAADQDRV